MLKGRIIKGVGGLYFVATDKGLYQCSIRGIFRKSKIIPTVGDYVEITILEDLVSEDEVIKSAVIEKIEERENILIRPKVANIDCAVITFAILSPNINMDLLDRFLALAENENIKKIVICINKSDLASNEQIKSIKDIYEGIYDIVFTSAIENSGIEELKNMLNEKVTVFAGPSGVGKSSLINSILPNADLKTGEISKKIERGKHTTRQVELLEAWENTYIVDSPGFTSLSMEYIENSLDLCFREFLPYLPSCKFCDCKHIHEPNCAVKDEVGVNISKQRYNRYIKLLKEIQGER